MATEHPTETSDDVDERRLGVESDEDVLELAVVLVEEYDTDAVVREQQEDDEDEPQPADDQGVADLAHSEYVQEIARLTKCEQRFRSFDPRQPLRHPHDPLDDVHFDLLDRVLETGYLSDLLEREGASVDPIEMDRGDQIDPAHERDRSVPDEFPVGAEGRVADVSIAWDDRCRAALEADPLLAVDAMRESKGAPADDRTVLVQSDRRPVGRDVLGDVLGDLVAHVVVRLRLQTSGGRLVQQDVHAERVDGQQSEREDCVIDGHPKEGSPLGRRPHPRVPRERVRTGNGERNDISGVHLCLDVEINDADDSARRQRLEGLPERGVRLVVGEGQSAGAGTVVILVNDGWCRQRHVCAAR